MEIDLQSKEEVFCLIFCDLAFVLGDNTTDGSVAVLFKARTRRLEVLDDSVLLHAEPLEAHTFSVDGNKKIKFETYSENNRYYDSNSVLSTWDCSNVEPQLPWLVRECTNLDRQLGRHHPLVAHCRFYLWMKCSL